jgi:sodium transport system permease protein
VRPGQAVWTIYGLELRSLLRDPRTLLVSIVLPVVLMPLLLIVSNRVERAREQREQTRTFKYAVTGTDSSFIRELLVGLPGPDTDDGDSAVAKFELVASDDPGQDLEDRELDFFVEGITADEWRAVLAEDSLKADDFEAFNDTPVARVHYRSNRTSSSRGANVLRDHLVEVRRVRRDSTIVTAGFPIAPRDLMAMDTANVASVREVSGARLGRMLSVFIILLMVTGGSVLATDTLAGEKERGTLVTLLTTAAPRTEIIWAKTLAVVTLALVIALVQVVNLWLYLGLGLIDVASGFAASITPTTSAVLLVLYVPVAALVAGVLLVTSAYAKSYKEAQLYLMPVILGLTVPALAPFLPEVTLSSAIVVVPLANIGIAARDVLIGQASWLAVGVSWLVTAGAAAYAMRLAVGALHDESLVTGADTDRAEFFGGPALFRKRVVRWFIVFWAVKVLIDMNIVFDDLRWTTVFNVGVVFLAAPFLMIWRFRLDPREALALRAPRPGVWIGVVLGAPAGLIVATLVFKLASFVIPVPREMLETFGQALFPEDIPLWQIIVLLSVIPGIVEELTFRGVLLHGLVSRYRPVMACVVAGVLFGFFHFEIFRIPGTALLGVVVAAVTLLTGSIFPAMLWHALNNVLGLYLESTGVQLIEDSWLVYAGGVVALALSFWIIWLNRTPYPGLQRSASRRFRGHATDRGLR